MAILGQFSNKLVSKEMLNEFFHVNGTNICSREHGKLLMGAMVGKELPREMDVILTVSMNGGSFLFCCIAEGGSIILLNLSHKSR